MVQWGTRQNDIIKFNITIEMHRCAGLEQPFGVRQIACLRNALSRTFFQYLMRTYKDESSYDKRGEVRFFAYEKRWGANFWMREGNESKILINNGEKIC